MLNGHIYKAKSTKISTKYDTNIYTSVADVSMFTRCYYDVIIITENGENGIISTKIDVAPKRLKPNH